jgi:hypothetical protein
METLGWNPAKVRNAAEKIKVTLENIRQHHRADIDKLKSDVKSVKDQDKYDAMHNKLKHAILVIAVVERVSLILSRQVISMVELMRDKDSTKSSNESLVAEDPTVKQCDKRGTASCPCDLKDKSCGLKETK